MPPVQQPIPSQSASMDVVGMDSERKSQEETRQTYEKKLKSGNVMDLIKTITIIALSLVSVTFVGLFIWMTGECKEARENVQSKIDVAVAEARDEQRTKDAAAYLESEKLPFKTFSGPVDYGQLTFQYPKTWSVYVADPATSGGDFNAYFNPIQVDTVAKDTINALRVSIVNRPFDTVAAEYQKVMDRKDSNLTMESVTVNGFAANRYTGKIPNTDLSGYIIIFKIRDKTAIVQTDSTLFEGDYNKLIETITFNA